MFDIRSLVVFAAVACGVYGLGLLLERDRKSAALAVSVRRGSHHWFFGSKLARQFRPSEKERLANKLWLLQAGFDSPDASQNYMATRVVLAIGLPVVFILIVPIFTNFPFQAVMVASLLAAAIGLLLPLLYVRRRRDKNQKAVREGLPDALDLLLVCTEAGLGLDTSILRVGEEMAATHPLMSNYLLQISNELRAGKPRAEAMRGFADRTGIPETTSLVNLMVQSDMLGSSMGATLRAFADDMRAHRLLRAEEIGHKVTVKLTMVLAGCFLPALLTAILAPLVNNILNTSFHFYFTAAS